MARKQIIIIDDEPLIGSLIQELLEEEPDFQIATSVEKRTDFFDAIRLRSYDAALIDISVDGSEGGFEILKTLRQENIVMPTIILSAHDEIDFALRALKAGATGYVNKSRICSHLCEGLSEVLNGRLYISGDMKDYILKQFTPS